jgi:hypothetical protein
MIDPRENPGAVMELRLLALRRVRGITDEQAKAFSVSGKSLFEWINYAPEMQAWRDRAKPVGLFARLRQILSRQGGVE